MLMNTLLLRQRLLDGIEQPTIAPVTLVTAPAGYGKSTLVSQWAKVSDSRVAWVSLGPESNSPPRFLKQLTGALADLIPNQAAAGVAAGDVVAWCFDALAQFDQPSTIVLDDYHVIENRDVHEVMGSLLSQVPTGVHVIVISRTIPPLPLGRMQAEGAVRHVTGDDLRFSPEETTAIVWEEAPDRLTDAQVATLGERTDGWIAGVRLALASLQQVDPATVPSLIDSWPVSQWLDDYIVEEVLDTLPDDVRDFVLRTASLPELTPDLCNAVLGIETSAGLLDEVSKRLVFVRPAGTTGEALTYHALLAESAGRIADRTWPVSDQRERHRRAALWYEGRGDLEAAVDQAVAAADWDLAERCVRPLARALMDRDSHHSRLHWLGKLPEDRVLADPDLAHWYLSALQLTGQLREAQRVFTIVEPMWEASGDPAQLGYAASARTALADLAEDIEQALRHCHEALGHFPPNYAVEILHCSTTVMALEFLQGNDAEVDRAHRQAVVCREMLPEEQWWWVTHFEAVRIDHLAQRGNLLAARDMVQEILVRLPAIYASRAGKFRFRLAAIALEQNDFDAARRQMKDIERDIACFPYVGWHADALVVIARILGAQGDTQRAHATLDRVRKLYDQYGGSRHRARLDAVQAEMWLQAGQLELAKAWAAQTEIQDRISIRIFGDPDPRVLLARVALADGASDRARDQLHIAIEQARAYKRWAEIVPLCMWHAVACVELGDDERALASLRTALQHGMEGGFVRSFLTPGFDFSTFLDRIECELAADEIAYLRHVLATVDTSLPRDVRHVVGASIAAAVPPNPDLVVELSRRELQVLVLMHQGCTNDGIASQLFVTRSTVKKHIESIFRKLRVSNRTGAVLRALELGVLTQ